MAKVIAFSFGMPGHLYPFMPILLELQARGHEVEACCAATVARATIATIPLSRLPLSRANQPDGDLTDPTRMRLDFATFGRDVALQVKTVIAESAPDCIIVDPMLWGAMVAARASGLPWASIASSPLCFRAEGLDVRGPGLAPARGVFSRIKHRVVDAWLQLRSRKRLGIVNEVRALHGLMPLRRHDEMLAEPSLVLATTVEPFEHPRADWPSHLRFVGPMLWQPPVSPNWRMDLPPDDRPIILLVGSSVPDPPGTRQWAADVLRSLAGHDYWVIATIPTGPLPPNPPPNAMIARTLPHMDLLRKATCVICHGAPGIVDKALSCGVPVISIPYGIDRYEVARRVELSGAGVTLSVRRLTPRVLSRAIAFASSAPVKVAARNIASLFAAAGGPTLACDEIEMLLTRR